MNKGLAVLVFSFLVDVFISFLVVYRNYKKAANVAFGLTSIGLASWAGLNFLSTYLPNNDTLFVTRLTGLIGALVITSFFTLSAVFPNVLPLGKRIKGIIASILVVICGLCLTSLFIKAGHRTATGLKLTEGPLSPIYSLYVVSMFVLCNINFVRQYRRSQKIAKSQLKLMWLGIVTTVVLILLSNVIIPEVTSNWSSSKFGTIFTIPFVAITAYAIVKQRMFDLRLIISRTIAYLITIGIVATIYAFGVILVTTQLVSFSKLTITQLLGLVIPAIFIALTFQKIQEVLNGLSRRIFYRNGYELRDVLDNLSDMLLVENNIDSMMRKSVGVLSEALKPTGTYLAVLNTSGKVYKQLEAGTLSSDNAASLMPHITKERDALIDASESQNFQLAKLMADSNTELMLRLGSKHTPTGLLLLGPKRNGSIYTTQDISLLRISAKNLGIALDNAKQYEQISSFADTMHKEVLRATASLRQANKELKTLDALKDDFISMASHQLRSPATSVHEAIQLLNDESGVSKEDRRQLLLLAEASSERLVGVIVDMLSMARIQAGHFILEKTQVDMAQLVHRAILEASVLARQKKINLRFTEPKQPISLLADRAKLNEMISNYIENAIKYSGTSTMVNLELRAIGKQVYFEVKDRGIGVPLAERKNMFGKFFRATNARKEEPNGNGIGLFVVKTIAEMHGGGAYYTPLDKGSLFGFWLPL